MSPTRRSLQLLPLGRRAASRALPLLLAAAVLQLACAGGANLLGPVEFTGPASQVAVSDRGMVASAAPLATEVGAEVLELGGNAVDAAVATAFALAVVEPAMSGLGGRTSIVIRATDGSIHGIDGLNQVPAGYTGGAPEGYDRAAIPGTPAALARALEEHGSWSLAAVLEPAIELAERGLRVLQGDADRMAGAHDDLVRHEASRRYFLRPDGSPLQAGDALIQEDLARALRAMASEGVEVFYGGWIADSIHVDMVEHGGFITREELAGYEALDAVPARGSYRGYGLAGNFRPASGHAVIQALHMMEEFDVPPATDPVGWASLTGQAMQIAIADRGRSFGSAEASAETLTSKEYARERAAEIRLPGPGGADRTALGPGGEVRLDEGSWLAADETQTTHMSVADASGMAVSLTQSIGPIMGTRLAARGVGFLYATRLGSTPGSRPSSTISPTLVLHPDGRLALAVGGAGNSRIISATIQTISRKIDHGAALETAVGSPRVHPGGAGELTAEDGDGIGWTPEQREALRALGFEVETASEQFFGRVHAIWFDPATGDFTGAADPRRDGTAAGPGG